MATKRIIIRTNLSEIPNSCRECKYHIFMWGNLSCPFCKDWIEPFEYRQGKKKLEDCPLVEEE